jgi:two-component system OmpR family response regulator
MRILVVEDDEVLSDVMVRSLTDAGHRIDLASSLADADGLWQVQVFDAVLLDLNLPQTSGSVRAMGNDSSGLVALRKARARGDRTPVLVLTARNRTEERIAGLDAGADDYLGKPFDLAEVEARLRALVRRAKDTEDYVSVAELNLDRKLRRFSIGRDLLELPAREFEVLVELMTPPGRVVSKRAFARTGIQRPRSTNRSRKAAARRPRPPTRRARALPRHLPDGRSSTARTSAASPPSSRSTG